MSSKLYVSVSLVNLFIKYLLSYRESQEFVEKYEGALGKGKGRKLYAYKVMMTKARKPPDTV